MSKKMLKRSLALGALMAFVITGQAWAEETNPISTISTTKDSSDYVVGIGSAKTVTDDVNITTTIIANADELQASIAAIGGGNNKVSIYSNNVVVNLNNITGSDVRAITARGQYNQPVAGGIIELGSSNTGLIDIDVVANVTKDAIGLEAYGNNDKADGANITVKTKKLEINVTNNNTGTDARAIGIHTGNRTQKGEGNLSNETTKMVINAEETFVTAQYGIQAASDSQLTINGDLTIYATEAAIETRGNAKTVINEKGDGTVKITGDVLYGRPNDAYDIDAGVFINLTNSDSFLDGDIRVDGAAESDITGMTLGLSNGATWIVTGKSFVNNLKGDGGIIAVKKVDGELASVTVTTDNATNLTVQQADVTADDFTTREAQEAQMKALASAVTVTSENSDPVTAADTLLIAEGAVVGAVTASVDENGNVGKVVEATNTTNQAIGEAAVALKSHWRAHMNDMNKRMGDLRMANGETGVWTRMVRGEAEYEGAKAQYNQYQLGYDEKLSVDERWTVGAAVTFAEGDSTFGKGTTEDDSTAFAIYGSKLNNDGTFVDLIARYARMESDVTSYTGNTGDYSTNGYSVSAEFGKRIQQGNGLWIEPQVELTYGSIDSADYKLDGKDIHVGDMDSLIGRIGFSLGKDIKQGNVYARASYLYDFDGETETAFSNAAGLTRTIEEDLGGGWWEVGVGANINLSKATYIYADVEKTFGGEVDTNWQWNLGVRYSF